MLISIKNESIHFLSHFYKKIRNVYLFSNVLNVIFHLYPYLFTYYEGQYQDYLRVSTMKFLFIHKRNEVHHFGCLDA